MLTKIGWAKAMVLAFLFDQHEPTPPSAISGSLQIDATTVHTALRQLIWIGAVSRMRTPNAFAGKHYAFLYEASQTTRFLLGERIAA